MAAKIRAHGALPLRTAGTGACRTHRDRPEETSECKSTEGAGRGVIPHQFERSLRGPRPSPPARLGAIKKHSITHEGST